MSNLEIDHGGIPYRARQSNLPDDPELGAIWFFEYRVLPDIEWRPRGKFHEKNGTFTWNGQTFPSARAALEARVEIGP